MDRSDSKIDMDALDAITKKVLAYRPPSKAEQKKQRAQHKTGRPPPAKSRASSTKPVGR